MEFDEISKRAIEIRAKYAELEIKELGREWTTTEILKGFKKDVSDLEEIMMSEEHNPNDLSHELSDCLWSVLVLANKYGIDIEKSFLKTMDELDVRISKDLVDRIDI